MMWETVCFIFGLLIGLAIGGLIALEVTRGAGSEKGFYD